MRYEVELYSEHILPDKIFLKLKKAINDEENNIFSLNKDLAGNIEKEFNIVKIDKEVVEYFKQGALSFFEKNIKTDDKKYDMHLSSLWVNKQKKYEFNPLHNHSGVVSFVCWVKIPYNLEDELNLNNCKNARNAYNSLFEFVYINSYGKISQKTLKINTHWEGKCIFFNSKLNHQVYPFYTSDEYRISVSGNLVPILSTKNQIFYN